MHEWQNLDTWFHKITLAGGWKPLGELAIGLCVLWIVVKLVCLLLHALAVTIHGWPHPSE